MKRTHPSVMPPAKRQKTLRVYICLEECIRRKIRWAECPCMDCVAGRNLGRALKKAALPASLGRKHDVVIYDNGQEDEGLYYDWEFRSPLPPAIGPAGSRQLGGHPNQQDERYSDR